MAHAQEHAGNLSEFDNMIAVLGLDNTVEYVLRIVAAHLELETITGKSFDIVDVASLSASINRALIDHAGKRLPYIAELKLLRQVRNLVQHGAVAPAADLQRFSAIVERFFDRTSKMVFGLGVDDLRISSAVTDPVVGGFLKAAEQKFDQREWLQSIVATRNAFENAYFERIRNLSTSISLYPALVQAREKNDISSFAWDVVKEQLELSSLGLNTFEYRRFKEYLRHIPHEFSAEDAFGSTVMQRPWNRADAEYCYSFCSGQMLRWQAQESERLYTPEFDDEHKFKELFGGISLSRNVEHGCIYLYNSDDCALLLYAGKDKKRRLERLQEDRDYIYRSSHYLNGVRDSTTRSVVRVLGVHSFLIVNEPEQWGVVIWYRELDRETVEVE